MADTFWLAQQEVAYEGAAFVGVFSSADKGGEACDQHAQARKLTSHDGWKEYKVAGWVLEASGGATYSVWRVTVDEVAR